MKLLTHFQKLYTISEHAMGAALITQTGSIILSFIESNLLDSILRTLEGRFHSGFTKIDVMVSKERDGELVLIGKDKFIVALLFRNDLQLPMALDLGQNFAKGIEKIISG